jgi:hypothetical protein
MKRGCQRDSPTSSVGQRRQSAPETMTSALPPRPDLPLHCANRRDGPIGGIEPIPSDCKDVPLKMAIGTRKRWETRAFS